MMGFRSIFFVFSVVLMIASAARAESGTPAIKGYDLVSYHTEGKPVRGSSDFFVHIDGVNYQFASDANKREFEKNPEKYLPAYDGYCALGVASNYKVDSDPEAWKIVNGRLYLNFNRSVQDRWSGDISGNIAKADRNWAKIKDKP